MAIVQLDKIVSGASGNIESIIVYTDDKATTPIEAFDNGLFVKAGKLVAGNPEAKVAVKAKSGDTDILLAHNPELNYDQRLQMRDYKNEAGKVVRGYRLALGDILTMTVGLLPEGAKVGDVLTVADGKLVTGGDLATEALAFTVIEDAGYLIDINEKALSIQVSKA